MKDHTKEQPALHMAVVPQNWLEEVTEKLETVKTLLEKKSVEERNAEWIDSVEARRMLGLSTLSSGCCTTRNGRRNSEGRDFSRGPRS